MKPKNEKKRILVAEEEEPIRKMLSQIFSKMGYQVMLAANGEEGLESFCKEKPCAVFTDLDMPGMDGWTLAKRIKEKSPHTQICLMTGWCREDIEPKIKEGIVDEVLFKPCGLYETRMMIEKMIQYTDTDQ